MVDGLFGKLVVTLVNLNFHKIQLLKLTLTGFDSDPHGWWVGKQIQVSQKIENTLTQVIFRLNWKVFYKAIHFSLFWAFSMPKLQDHKHPNLKENINISFESAHKKK